jgi:hypothetical protein
MRHVSNFRIRAAAVCLGVFTSTLLGWPASAIDVSGLDPNSVEGLAAARSDAQKSEQADLRAQIAGYQAQLTASGASSTDVIEAKLNLARCYLDIRPGEELLALQYASEALDARPSPGDKAQAKLLMAESYRNWRYQALKLYTQVIDEHPGTIWEAWAKVGMARTLAEFVPGGDTEPVLQCERAAKLLDEVVSAWPAGEPAAAAKRLVPAIRAHYDLPAAIRDLERVAPDLPLWEVDDLLHKISMKAADAGINPLEVSHRLHAAAQTSFGAIPILAQQRAALLAVPLADAEDKLSSNELLALLEVTLAGNWLPSLQEAGQLAKLAPELVPRLPLERQAWASSRFGALAYFAGDQQVAETCLTSGRDALRVFDPGADRLEVVFDLTRLAKQLGDDDAVEAVLELARQQWPNHGDAGALLHHLAVWQEGREHRDEAGLLYRQLLAEFPMTRHAELTRRWIEDEYVPR